MSNLIEYPIYKKYLISGYNATFQREAVILADTFENAKKTFALQMTENLPIETNDLTFLDKSNGIEISGWYKIISTQEFFPILDNKLQYKEDEVELVHTLETINAGVDKWRDNKYAWEIREPILFYMKQDFLKILDKTLAGFHYSVQERKNCFGGEFLAINIATSDYAINNVRGQFYNNISMSLDSDLELKFQIYGGNGGQSIYRTIDPNIEREKYLALSHEKISYRTPQKNKEAVLKAFQKVCERYIETLININDRGLLRSDNLEHTQKLLAPQF